MIDMAWILPGVEMARNVFSIQIPEYASGFQKPATEIILSEIIDMHEPPSEICLFTYSTLKTSVESPIILPLTVKVYLNDASKKSILTFYKNQLFNLEWLYFDDTPRKPTTNDINRILFTYSYLFTIQPILSSLVGSSTLQNNVACDTIGFIHDAMIDKLTGEQNENTSTVGVCKNTTANTSFDRLAPTIDVGH